jgi:predicted enzyme related to lactoylglutathione lyase
MLENAKAFSGFAVDDIERARQFYGGTVGLRTSEDNGLLTLHLAGGRDTLVYAKPGHAPATYTILNFPVDDIEAVVDELEERGTRASSRTRRASRAQAADLRSRGSRILRGTSCPCSKAATRRPQSQ